MTSAELREWLTSYVTQLLGLEREAVLASESFERSGMDSSGAVGLCGDLEDLLGCKLDLTLVYDHPTIDGLVDHFVATGLVRSTEQVAS